MRRRYLLLGMVVVVCALLLTALGRPRHRDEPPPTAVATPVTELAMVIADGDLSPAASAVPKGQVVRLRVEHRGPGSVRLALAGYEDRLAIPALATGAVWTGEFVADRPGEDFTWTLDGRPAGRFSVTGSHLVEGHR